MAHALATAGKIAYVAGMLAIAAAGSLNMVSETVKDVPLDGVETQAKKPELTPANVRSEEFQREATTWFERKWGLRGYAVRTDNTLNDSVFGETRPGQGVHMANKGILVIHEDLVYFNRTDAPDETVASARRFARVQKRLRETGRLLVPVILPSKTSVFRDDLPPSFWRQGAPAMSDRNIYGAFVKELTDSGALFVDGRKLLQAEGDARYAVFTRTGRHWTTGSACRVMQALTDLIRHDIPELGDAQLDCHMNRWENPPLTEEEFDLFRLLNVWAPRPEDVPVFVYQGTKGGEPFQIPTLYVGSSFLWKMLHLSRYREVFGPRSYYYYDRTLVEGVEEKVVGKLEPFTDAWRKDTFSKRLIVLDVLETYLPSQGQDFLAEMEKELDDPSSPVHVPYRAP